jgi:hypothetical protein
VRVSAHKARCWGSCADSWGRSLAYGRATAADFRSEAELYVTTRDSGARTEGERHRSK